MSVWRARLDGEAALMHSSGYRSNALDAQDLQRVVADPDLTTELRSGAARVLLQFGGAAHKPKVDLALATLGSHEARRHFHLTIADLDIDDEDEAAKRQRAR